LRAREFESVVEAKVQRSTWIADITYLPFPIKDLILTLKNGRQYKIHNVPPAIYQQFLTRPSKGKFWHSNMRGKYKVTRIN
jgi:hypothetical protein